MKQNAEINFVSSTLCIGKNSPEELDGLPAKALHSMNINGKVYLTRG